MFIGKGFGILGLVAQAGAVCFWAYFAGYGVWMMVNDPAHKLFTAGAVILNLAGWAMAAATLYCLFRQLKFPQEDSRFRQWLIANAEKIRNNNPVFYRSQRITLDTELVKHHLVFSALVVSFRMQTRWLIKNKEPRFGHALAASLYTFIYGWWGFPFGIYWTVVALVKNLTGSTSVAVRDLLQPAPAKPSTFGDRFQRDFSTRLHRGFFVDEKPAGILPTEPVSKS